MTLFPRLLRTTLRQGGLLLGGLALLGTTVSAAPATQPAEATDLNDSPQGWRQEALELTQLTHSTFWDADAGLYVSPVAADGTVSSEGLHGYTLWAWTEALRMLVAAEAHFSGEFSDEIATVYAGMEKYFDPQRSAYNAWVMFPGNIDSYSDDNAWLIMALTDAARLTGRDEYARRAHDVMENYVATEWRDDDGPLGMRWGFRPDGPPHQNMRAAISASTSAVAAIKLAELGYNAEGNLQRADRYLQWIEDHCIDEDGLVIDGLTGPQNWRVERTRWTYNSGLVIIANGLLYEQTGRPELLARVRRTAEAAIDRSGRMYDGIITDPARNIFYDSTFFASHLIEALVMASEWLEDPKYRQEAARNARFIYTHLRDEADGLYFRNMRLWRIDPQRYERFRTLFAGGYDAERLRYDPDPAERTQSRADRRKAVDERSLTKTLLPNAAVARAYWALAESDAAAQDRQP